MTDDSRGNLLNEKIISVRTANGLSRLTLPGLLSGLGRGEAMDFVALRPHQRHPWYAFVVQLAALVIQQSGEQDLNRPDQAWRDDLLRLVGNVSEAWQMVVQDVMKPAFMQTPVPEGSLEKGQYKNVALTPDEIDTLITTRNHDVKRIRMYDAGLEHWLYALISLQTMEGYLGVGNYGIARMNGGYSSRPAFASTPELNWTARFQRDVAVWIDARNDLVKEHGYKNRGGRALLWLEPWDGNSTRSLLECDPFFIEICRRVRLSSFVGGVFARTAGTKNAFLDSKQNHGNTGDIWTPVSREGKALTVGPDGISYRLMTEVLFRGEYPQAPALRITERDGKHPFVIAQVLVRGKSKTDHYRERILPVPPKARLKLLADESLDDIRKLARKRIERVNDAVKKVLRPALCVLLQNDPHKLDFRDSRPKRWTEQFDEAVDEVFFDDLWEAIDLSQDEAEEQWDRRLVSLAGRQLEEAIKSVPDSSARKPRVIARAELIFRGCSHKYLPAAHRHQIETEVAK